MVSWATLQTAVFLLGPIILPKLIATIRSTNLKKSSTRALERQTKFSLNILAIAAILALASSLTYSHSENIITATGARLLLTPNDVLMRRVEKLRQRQGLLSVSDNDITLLNALRTREGRLLYAMYGPIPLIECSWCTVSDPSTYLYYVIPKFAAPHVLNIAALGLVTSSLSSKASRFLRIPATIAGLGVALGELLLLYNYDHLQNTQATNQVDVDWFHWRLAAYRGLAIALIDCVFGALVYLVGTGRYGANGVLDLEKIEAISKLLDAGLSHVRTGLFIKSTTIRHESILMGVSSFWNAEAASRRHFATQLEDTRNQILERINLDSINEEASRFTSELMDAVITAKGSAIPADSGVGI